MWRWIKKLYEVIIALFPIIALILAIIVIATSGGNNN